MTMMDTAKLLTKIGAILCIVLGFVSIALNGVSIALSFGWYMGFGIVWSIIPIAFSVMSLIIGFIVYTKYLPAMDEDPHTTGIYLIILGILAALGAWYIGGVLILVAGILILVEKESAA